METLHYSRKGEVKEQGLEVPSRKGEGLEITPHLFTDSEFIRAWIAINAMFNLRQEGIHTYTVSDDPGIGIVDESLEGDCDGRHNDGRSTAAQEEASR